MEFRAWRQANGYKLKDIAELVETTIATISRLETRTRKTIRAKMVYKIFNLTSGQVTPNDLYGITENQISEIKKKKQKKAIKNR